MAAALVPLALAAALALVRHPLTKLLPLYAIAVPFGSGLAVAGGQGNSLLSPSSALAALLILALVLNLGRPSGKGRLQPTAAIWLAFAGVITGTAVWSLRPAESLTRSLTLSTTILLFLLLAVTPVSVSVVRRLEKAIVAGAVLMTGYGLFQAVSGTLPTTETGSQRFGVDLIGHNHVGAALLLPLSITLWRATTAHSRSRFWSAAAALWIVLGILLTQSRGALLGTVAVLIVLVACAPKRGQLVGWIAVAVAVIAVVVLANPGDIGARQANTGSSGRGDIWTVGYAACAEYCLVGSGWNTFDTVYQSTQAGVAGAAVLRGESLEPHNNLLLAAVETGLLGLVLFITGLAAAWRLALRIPPPARGSPLAALTALFVTGSLLSNLEFRYFWLVLMYVYLVAGVDPQEPFEPREAQRLLAPTTSGPERPR